MKKALLWALALLVGCALPVRAESRHELFKTRCLRGTVESVHTNVGWGTIDVNIQNIQLCVDETKPECGLISEVELRFGQDVNDNNVIDDGEELGSDRYGPDAGGNGPPPTNCVTFEGFSFRLMNSSDPVLVELSASFEGGGTYVKRRKVELRK